MHIPNDDVKGDGDYLSEEIGQVLFPLAWLAEHTALPKGQFHPVLLCRSYGFPVESAMPEKNIILMQWVAL